MSGIHSTGPVRVEPPKPTSTSQSLPRTRTFSAMCVRGRAGDRVRLRQSDTDTARYDTGAYGSAGVVVAAVRSR